MFGEYLIKNNYITDMQLTEALEAQEFSNDKLGRILKNLRMIEEDFLDQVLSDYLGIQEEASILSKVTGVDKKSVRVIKSTSSARGFYFTNENLLYLEEFKDEILKKLEEEGVSPEIRFISKEQARVLESVKRGKELINEKSFLGKNSEKVEKGAFDRFVYALIKQAKELSASDLHFDTEDRGLVVRMRINGDLEEIKVVGKSHVQMVMTRVRAEVGLPLSVVGKACSGSKVFHELGIKVRSESAPETMGETVVCRIIDMDKNKGANLSGISGDSLFLDPLERAMKRKNGLILMCGQTGSGKSYTLFSTLMSMDRKKKKVLSIEDPVEYEGDGISQIDVNKNQITFSEALRSSLRLDPDVIMVGEIRDKETAELAMKAASTGHLVFSTLHTNGAIQAIGRLQGMGIPSDILEENIELVSALTLRKKLCPECRVIRKNFSDEEALEFSSLIGQGVELFEASGRSCGKPGCFNGVLGRQLITESIGREAVSAKIRGEIVPGYRTLKECAKEYACLGVISSKDVVGL